MVRPRRSDDDDADDDDEADDDDDDDGDDGGDEDCRLLPVGKGRGGGSTSRGAHLEEW